MARARTKVRARAKKADVRRSTARPTRAKANAPKARRQHKFVASHLTPDAFKADGLRSYAHYRDLGVKDATRGMALAHVIRFVGKCDPKIVSKKHTHECEFQMIYVLKGMIKTEIEGHGKQRSFCDVGDVPTRQVPRIQTSVLKDDFLVAIRQRHDSDAGFVVVGGH